MLAPEACFGTSQTFKNNNYNKRKQERQRNEQGEEV